MALYTKTSRPRHSVEFATYASRLLDFINGAYPCFKRFLDSWGVNNRNYLRCVKNNFESYADCLDVSVAPFLDNAHIAEGVLGLVYLFNRARIDRDFILAEAYVEPSPKDIVQKHKEIARKLNAKRDELNKAYQDYDKDVLQQVRTRLVALIEGMEMKR